ncbi:MAG: ribonuclease Y [Actinobacteria bacterium]|nr:ribonuclease Y [Actinomycetota bacterium]
MEPLIAAVAGVAAVAVGLGAGYFYQVWLSARRESAFGARIQQALAEVEAQQRAMLAEATQAARETSRKAEAEIRERRRELRQQERRTQLREETLERRAEKLDDLDREFLSREELLTNRRRELDAREAELAGLRQQHMGALERVADLAQEDAKAQLLASIEREVSQAADQLVRRVEADAKEHAEAKARWLVGLALQRVAASHTTEITTSVVDLKSDELKGRIIGREGRNIRALEAATGVDIIIDDTPETVVISAFDPVRREVARLALARLVEDGRIHPARIEESVNKAQSEVNEIIVREGERAAYDAGVAGLPSEILRTMGRLRFRHSYGQNVLSHSVEVSLLAATIAAEAGGNVDVARQAGLVHDVGKAIDHEVEGPHALIGGQLLRRAGVGEAVAHAAEAHHFEVELKSFEAFAVAAADAISASRPGARRETVTRYLQRLEKLEEIAKSFQGVESCYAIQAGRELRVLINPDLVDELGIHRLTRDIAKRIEDTMEYPGQIRITAIRETRAVDYAK